jgi:hypothetical protein
MRANCCGLGVSLSLARSVKPPVIRTQKEAIPGQSPLDRSWPNFGLDNFNRDLQSELESLGWASSRLLHRVLCLCFLHNCERFEQRLANDAGSRASGEIVTKACNMQLSKVPWPWPIAFKLV